MNALRPKDQLGKRQVEQRDDIVDWVYVLEGTIVSVIIFTIGAVVFRRSVPRVLKEL